MGNIIKLLQQLLLPFFESILLMALIDAQEGHDVAIADVPNAFIQMHLEDNNNKAIMCLRGPLAMLLCNLAPKVYHPFLKKDRQGQPVLYVHILNVLYGIMKATLLYYRRFINDIQLVGFTLNPYDPCIANKQVDGHQLTLVWHINDIKVSHVEECIVTDFINWLKHTYELIFEDGSGSM